MKLSDKIYLSISIVILIMCFIGLNILGALIIKYPILIYFIPWESWVLLIGAIGYMAWVVREIIRIIKNR